MPHAGVRRHRAARPTGGILDAMRPQSPSPTRDAVPAPQENVWLAAVRADPEHPRRYAQRWDRFEEMGRDIDGEARLVDSLAERGARDEAAIASRRAAASSASSGMLIMSPTSRDTVMATRMCSAASEPRARLMG